MYSAQKGPAQNSFDNNFTRIVVTLRLIATFVRIVVTLNRIFVRIQILTYQLNCHFCRDSCYIEFHTSLKNSDIIICIIKVPVRFYFSFFYSFPFVLYPTFQLYIVVVSFFVRFDIYRHGLFLL